MADNKQADAPITMESIHRIAKIPVVESSINTATNVYGYVKEYNDTTKWAVSTMEGYIHSAVETGKPYAEPVVRKLDKQIKQVDGVINCGLDYVESKVPAVKLPPGEIYNTTKDYVTETVTPTVNSAVKQVHDIVDPAVNAARTVVDPAVKIAMPHVEKAYKIVEPVIQPAMEKAQALKDYGTLKMGEYLHLGESTEIECKDCQDSNTNQNHENSNH